MTFSAATQALAKVVRDAQSRSQMYWAWHCAMRMDAESSGQDNADQAERIFQQYEDASTDLSNALELYFEQTQKEHCT